MDACRTCGAQLAGLVTGECPGCGASLTGVTESFPSVHCPATTLPCDLVAESVAPASTPMLVVRKGAETGERLLIDGARITVGRDPSADIFLNDVTVSRSHAVITSDPARGVAIEDCRSLNGTYVNSVRVESATLRHGDIVQIGMFQLSFVDAMKNESS